MMRKKMVQLLAFSVLALGLVGAAALTGQPARAQLVDFKTAADSAYKVACQKREDAVAKQQEASGVRECAMKTRASAEFEFAGNFQDMSDLKRWQYSDSLKFGDEQIKQGDLHMAAFVSRLWMGGKSASGTDPGHGRLKDGDDLYYATPPNYPVAHYCYHNESSGSAMGAYQHFACAVEDASSAMYCWMGALGYFAHAESLAMFP